MEHLVTYMAEIEFSIKASLDNRSSSDAFDHDGEQHSGS